MKFNASHCSIILLVLSPDLGIAATLPAGSEQSVLIPRWFWWLFILAVVLPILWWWNGRARKEVGRSAAESIEERTGEQDAPSLPILATTATEEEDLEQPSPATSQVELPLPDDLKRIEGIGPKISDLLQGNGIATFAHLAETDVARLKQIVRGAGIRAADPTTWPEQAALAAAAKWEELGALQDQLKGGRRV
ncbi:MAG TPA: DUF4332 domain-containing protein [Chloroflexi bacterium]|nr:DUF4332 domain-containing protein [Chloroflexota bacterium]